MRLICEMKKKELKYFVCYGRLALCCSEQLPTLSICIIPFSHGPFWQSNLMINIFNTQMYQRQI